MERRKQHGNQNSGTAPTAAWLYEKLPEVWGCELIFGRLHMSPSPSKEHQLLLIKLTAKLFSFLENSEAGILLTAPFDVHFDNEESTVQPDLFVVLKDNEHLIEKNGVHGSPSIIIEVISTNRSYDTKRKRTLYEKAGVKEYFMIDPENKKVTLLTLNASGVYDQTYEETGVLRSAIINCDLKF